MFTIGFRSSFVIPFWCKTFQNTTVSHIISQIFMFFDTVVYNSNSYCISLGPQNFF